MMRLRILGFVSALLAVLAVSGAVSYAQVPAWPTRSVRFMVPFGPGAAADIGARLFAEKLSERWGQPVVVENRPGGDSIIAITAFLSANDDHVLLYMPSGNFTVHPFLHSKLPYDPNDLNPIVRTSNTILAVALAKSSPYNTIREFTEAARANPGKFNSGLVPGLTEFTFWAYTHHENLNITQVPYRDINLAPTDLAEGRIQVVMASLAIVQPQWRADRIKLIALNNKTRTVACTRHSYRVGGGLPLPGIRRSSWSDRPKDHVEGTQGAHRGRFQGGGRRRLDRFQVGGHRLGDQCRGPG